jgi:hypothetical protein
LKFGPLRAFSEPDDGALVYTSIDRADRRKKQETITPTAAELREFRQPPDYLRVWQWQTDHPNWGTLDGTQSSFEIAYADRALKTRATKR